MTTTLDRAHGTDRLESADAPAAATTGPEPRSRPGPELATVLGSLVVLAGLLIGAQPIRDNSFLTHLATGRLILQEGVPSVDPYSATASGEPWVVQSWLASLLYGATDALAGPVGLRVLMALTTAVLAALIWMLTDRLTSVVPRVALVMAMIGIGASAWDPRPLLFGLIGVAIVLLVIEQRVDARWLLPTMWLWANVHGSFPLGIVILVAWWGGTRWSGEVTRSTTRAIGWALGGVAASCISPLGPKILSFPVQLLGRSETLSEIKEWQSPDFSTTPARLFLLLVAASIMVLARRPDKRDAVMVIVAIGLGLMAGRNLAVASLILAPVLARGAGSVGTLRVDQRLAAGRVGVAAIVALAGLTLVTSLQQPSYALAAYPVRSLAWLEHEGLIGDRQRLVASRDYVGNLSSLLYGPGAGSFIDDRYDMYPAAVSEDYFVLLDGGAALEVLDRREVDIVLWDRGTALSELLATSPDWGTVFSEDRWIVACRRPSPAAAPRC